MFFRLTNSPATFQTMMNSIFTQEMAESWLTIYIDDMAIHTQKGKEELEQTHQQHSTNVSSEEYYRNYYNTTSSSNLRNAPSNNIHQILRCTCRPRHSTNGRHKN
jgi:hypothetical protein